MVKMRNFSKRYYFKQIVVCWLIWSMMLAFIPVRIAKAAPANPVGQFGGATFDVSNPLGVTVTINGMQTIIHWDSLNTTKDEFLTFLHNGNINGAVLNRVLTGGTTIFNGALNGEQLRIFMINPAGIVFGQGARINVSQLVASSLDIADDDFLSGAPYEFINGATAGDVLFNARAANVVADRLFLIGKHVRNMGGLVAREFAVMAAGDKVLISEPGSSVAVEVDMGGMDPAQFTVENRAFGSGDEHYRTDYGKDTDWTPPVGGRWYVGPESPDDPGGPVPTSVEAEHIILAAGDVWSAALVKAYSDDSFSPVATIEIKAAGDVTVTDKVIAEAVGNRENDAVAAIAVDAGGNVDVIAHAWMEKDEKGNVIGHDGEALIQADTKYGATNTSEILICADGHVTVEAEGLWDKCEDLGADSTASIKAIAQSGGEGTAEKNTADVQIDAQEGINVTAISKPYNTQVSASITAEAYNGAENTANILTCSDEGVLVKSEQDSVTPAPSNAYIKSVAGAWQMMTSSDAKTTVISHQGNVVVDSSLGGNASIESEAYGSYFYTDTATTQVYATDVVVTGGGSSISAQALGVRDRGDGFRLTSDGRVEETDYGATLIIDYSWCEDCPDCPPCQFEDDDDGDGPDEEVFAPIAPLPPYHIPRIEGCPQLTQSAAAELGITEETLQVGMGDALALNPNIQPCQACASLLNAASILKDVDGSRMAAMVQVFNTIAPADAPYTPEMATSIAMAFDDAAEGSQYASAMEFIDAFVQYAAALEELGSPTGDPTAFVMTKYGDELGDNSNMASFVAGRIEGGQTF